MLSGHLAYWNAWTEVHTRDSRTDTGSSAAETVVITGVSLLGAAVIAAVLWATLKGGASNVTVPPPPPPNPLVPPGSRWGWCNRGISPNEPILTPEGGRVARYPDHPSPCRDLLPVTVVRLRWFIVLFPLFILSVFAMVQAIQWRHDRQLTVAIANETAAAVALYQVDPAAAIGDATTTLTAAGLRAVTVTVTRAGGNQIVQINASAPRDPARHREHGVGHRGGTHRTGHRMTRRPHGDDLGSGDVAAMLVIVPIVIGFVLLIMFWGRQSEAAHKSPTPRRSVPAPGRWPATGPTPSSTPRMRSRSRCRAPRPRAQAVHRSR